MSGGHTWKNTAIKHLIRCLIILSVIVLWSASSRSASEGFWKTSKPHTLLGVSGPLSDIVLVNIYEAPTKGTIPPLCSFRVTVLRGSFGAGLVSRWSYRAPSYLTMITTFRNVFHHFNSPQNIQKITIKTTFWGEPQVTFLLASSSWSRLCRGTVKW